MLTKSLYGIGLNIGKGQNGYLTILADKRLIANNLRQIIFTNPGERVNNPSFGVGIERYLFEPNTFTTKRQIEDAIRQQVALYLPVIDILKIDYKIEDTSILIALVYKINDYTNAVDTLTIKRDFIEG